MALEKITEAQMNANGVIAAPDVLNGTAAENKAIFDRMVRSVVAPAYNACVDAVNALQALDAGLQASEEQREAAEAGRADAEIDRVTAETARVQAELERVAAELARAAAETDRESAEAARENLETGYVAQARQAAEDAEAAADRAEAGTSGDMKASVYDPQGKSQDVFAYAENCTNKNAAPKVHAEQHKSGGTDPLSASDIGGLSMQLVWTNSDPSSSFARQTVPLTLKSGEAVFVDACDATGYTGQKAAVRPFLFVGERGRILRMSQSWNNFAERVVTVYESGVEFDNAYLRGFSANSAQEDNDQCIPTKIYVVRGVLG